MSTLTITSKGTTTTEEYDESDAAAFALMVEKFNAVQGTPLRYATVDGKSETITELPSTEAQVTVVPQYVGG